jgi:hypothetical protein
MLQRLKAAQDQGVDVNGLWIQDWAGIKKTSFGQRLLKTQCQKEKEEENNNPQTLRRKLRIGQCKQHLQQE